MPAPPTRTEAGHGVGFAPVPSAVQKSPLASRARRLAAPQDCQCLLASRDAAVDLHEALPHLPRDASYTRSFGRSGRTVPPPVEPPPAMAPWQPTTTPGTRLTPVDAAPRGCRSVRTVSRLGGRRPCTSPSRAARFGRRDDGVSPGTYRAGLGDADAPSRTAASGR